MINTIQHNLYSNITAALDIDTVCYLYSTPSKDAANSAPRSTVSTYQNADGTTVLTSRLNNPFVRLTYNLGFDQTGKRQQATWKNVQYLTFNHMHDLKVVLNQLLDALNDPEAFVLNASGAYEVSKKYLNAFYGFTNNENQVVFGGRLHAVTFEQTEYGTNTVRTISVPGVALQLLCGNGNYNLLTLNDFKTIYEILTNINLVQVAQEATFIKYFDTLNDSKVGHAAYTNTQRQTSYGTQRQPYGQNTSIPGVNSAIPTYGRPNGPTPSTSYGKPAANKVNPPRPNYNNYQSGQTHAQPTIQTPYNQPMETVSPEDVPQPAYTQQYQNTLPPRSSGTAQAAPQQPTYTAPAVASPYTQPKPVQQPKPQVAPQPVVTETNLSEDPELIIDDLDSIDIPDYGNDDNA